MSWEIYVSNFEDGERYEINTSQLRAVFERDALPHPPWPPRNTDFLYDDGHVRMDIAEMGPRCESFVMSRIFGQTAVARLLEAAALFNGLICWPGDEPCVAVATSATLAHLPQSAIDAGPVVTETSAAFIKTVGFPSEMTKQDWLKAMAEYERECNRRERNYRPR